MRIFVLVPVFNRLAHTRRMLDALRAQTLAASLRIVVIDDGSTDGTGEFLRQQPDVTTLVGNGALWWGGAMQKGLEWVLAQRPDADDYVLFQNNDTWFEPGYVQHLLDVSRSHGNAAVGSVVHEVDHDPPLVSIGPRVNINRLAVWDILAELTPEQARHPEPVYRVDALSGRGTLYPALLFARYGLMRPRLLPHYLADYEVAMRFARHGVPLLVSTQAVVHSPPVYGNSVAGMGFWQRWFSRRSSSNVIFKTFFYLLVGSPLQRVTAPLRMAVFFVSRAWRKWIS